MGKKLFTIIAFTIGFSISAQVGKTTTESVLGQTFSQNNEFDDSKCLLVNNNAANSTSSGQAKNAAKSFIERNKTSTQSSTEVISFLKAYGTDTWLINKTTNNAITIQSYPESVNNIALIDQLINIIKPDGTYLVHQYLNHGYSGNKIFYEIPADSPLGEYKVEMSVFKNDHGGYRLNCLSDSAYLAITADTSIAPTTETHVFKNTAGTEWDITQSESFSIGNDLHEWLLPLTEGENLTIDLYNIDPLVLPSYKKMDTMLYLLDASNNVVASNDDGGNNENARIYYTVPATGDYKVIATNYGLFSDINWSVDLTKQDSGWGLGATGITYYDLKIKSSSIRSYTFEAFALINPAAIKINAILLTDDENLVDVPVTTDHIQNLITDLNTDYNNLYNSNNWPGFELAGITKFYNTEHATTGNPHGVLSEIGSGPSAKKNYLNLIFTEIDGNLSGIVGTTNLYNNVTGPNGAAIVLDDVDGTSGVLIHEMGHVIGMNHLAGSWPPVAHSLTLQNSTMGYTTAYISRPENSFMSNWESYPINYTPYISLYLTSQPSTLKTTSYGDLFSEAFRSWLITNNYINADAPSTGYEGNDISKAVSASWVQPETIAGYNSAFTSIASSKNAANNHAAYAVQNAYNTQLYYGFRNTDNSWTHNNYTTNTGRQSVDMNSSGDAVIIIEPWYNKQLTAIYKAHDENEWSAPQVISNSEKNSIRSNFEINNNGDVAVVWLDINSQLDRSIKFREMVNGTWTTERILSSSANIKELPSIAYTDNGDVFVTWQEWNINNSQRFDVVGKFRNGATQSWGALETFSDATNHAGFSQVAMNSAGDAIVYWRQATGTFVANKANNPVGELNVRYRNYDGTLENTVTVSPLGEDSLNAAAASTEPRIVFEDGHAAVTWWGVNGGHNVVYASIMANKTTWNTTALTGNGKNSDLPSISIGNNGFVAVAWQRTDGLHQRIQSKFYDASTNSWSAVMTMSDAGSDAIHSDIAADDNYSATASWVRWNVAASKYVPEIKQYTPLVITLLGENPFTLEAGTSYIEPGATAINSSGVNISANIQMTGIVNASVVGTYIINYDAADSDGNVSVTMTRTVHVVDTTLPIITLVGDISIIVEIGSTYSDAGATASDTYDGVISSSSIAVSSTVDTLIPGDYTVTYNVSDASGNAAVPVMRSVKVAFPCGYSEGFESFPPSGWTMINSDVPLNDIIQSSTWSSEGSYSLRLSNRYGSPTVNQYLISPELVTTESDRYMKFLIYGPDHTEKYRVGWSSTGIALDDFTWGANKSGDWDPSEYEKTDLPIGTKYIIIEHIDYPGWSGPLYIDDFCLPQLFANTIAPEITLNGDAVISLEFGAAYTDAGATALDNTDGDITSNITTVNPVDVNTVGTYTITYNVSDAAGNAATQVTRTVHVTANVWDGSTDSDWNTAANWSLNSVPSTTAKIRVPKTGITNFPTASAAVTINSAYIESGATLIAQSTFSGTVTYERNLAVVDTWYLVSSPVSEETIVDLISNHTFATITDIGTGGSVIGIATYNNSTLSWDYLTINSTGTLTSGKGYSTLLDAAGNISFTGTLPVTDVGIAITTNINGFNLVGNPYPSFIAANNNANTTHNLLKVNATDKDYLTEATIWLWNQATTSYDQINQAHTTHIAPGQGFFVSSNGNHTFSITEAMQSHQGTDTFQKSTNIRPEVQLILTNGTKIRNADIFYIDGKTTGFDNGYDSSIFGGSSHSFAVYTEAVANGTGKKLGTQSLPNTNLESMVIPVGVIAAVNAEITFSAEVLNLPDGIKVLLEDRSTNTFTRLDEVNSEYKVTLSEGANGIGRFYMHTTSSVLNTTEINLENISIYKTNSSTLRIVGLSQGKSTFKLFDVLGKQVVHTTFESDGVSDITLPKLPAGIYIVQLENKAGKLNKKIVLN